MQTVQQFIERIDNLVEATEQSGRYNDVLFVDYDRWYNDSVHRRDRRINTKKCIVGCATIFVTVFIFTSLLLAQPDYKTHYASQPCDVNRSVQNIQNILSL